MASISKLVIVREAKGKAAAADLMKDFAPFLDTAREQPIAIIPLAWGVENNASHVGFVLVGMKLKNFLALAEWEKAHPVSTVLPFDPEAQDGVNLSLAAVGLRVHPLAE